MDLALIMNEYVKEMKIKISEGKNKLLGSKITVKIVNRKKTSKINLANDELILFLTRGFIDFLFKRSISISAILLITNVKEDREIIKINKIGKYVLNEKECKRLAIKTAIIIKI